MPDFVSISDLKSEIDVRKHQGTIQSVGENGLITGEKQPMLDSGYANSVSPTTPATPTGKGKHIHCCVLAQI